jgi:hypothetical protein
MGKNWQIYERLADKLEAVGKPSGVRGIRKNLRALKGSFSFPKYARPLQFKASLYDHRALNPLLPNSYHELVTLSCILFPYFGKTSGIYNALSRGFMRRADEEVVSAILEIQLNEYVYSGINSGAVLNLGTRLRTPDSAEHQTEPLLLQQLRFRDNCRTAIIIIIIIIIIKVKSNAIPVSGRGGL